MDFKSPAHEKSTDKAVLFEIAPGARVCWGSGVAAVHAADVGHDARVGQDVVPHAGFSLGMEPSLNQALAVGAETRQANERSGPQNDPSPQLLPFG